MNGRPLYIFDLDGTLALNGHRAHLLDKTDAGWRAFYAACDRDEPNEPVLRMMDELAYRSEIWVWSGRSDEVKEKTIEWLRKYSCYPLSFNVPAFRMRNAKDHQPDVSLKRKWLHELSKYDRSRIVGVFDDRSSVVEMWREEGLTCFQVAKGDF